MVCDAVADQGIPDFWLTAMANHDMIGEYVTERDADVSSRGCLKHAEGLVLG